MLCLAMISGGLALNLLSPEDKPKALGTEEITLKQDTSMNQYNSYDFRTEKLADFENGFDRPDIGITDPDMVYKTAFLELPLISQDYYRNKYENAVAGAKGINRIPVLKPGDKTSVIRQLYIDINPGNGFVYAPAHYFGSGVCWSTSALGLMMNRANDQFKAKYGIDLFVYKAWDRAPHPDYYATYHGNGYTILQMGRGDALQDYTFTVNPKISELDGMSDFKVKVVMLNSNHRENASHGQSIAGYVLTNKDF